MNATTIRAARADEVAHLPEIEESGAVHFRRAGMGLVADMPATAAEAYTDALAEGRVLLACDEQDRPVGFVHLDEVDGAGYVAQLSVHPAYAGQRLGARLLEAAEHWARRRGLERLVLTTYRAVPWNAPYYERLGWSVLHEEEWGPDLTAVRRREHELGLDRWARVAMVKELARPTDRPVLRTPRLELRPLTLAHLPLLHLLDSDPEVMRHLTSRPRTPAEVDACWEPVCAEPESHGLGYWVGLLGEEAVGWWQLTPAPGSPADLPPTVAEIGWRLRPCHWGQGLATEGARALLHHGFERVGLDRVRAETMAVNTRSRSVMAKLEMTHVRTELRRWPEPVPGADQGEAVYEITAEEWARSWQ